MSWIDRNQLIFGRQARAPIETPDTHRQKRIELSELYDKPHMSVVYASDTVQEVSK